MLIAIMAVHSHVLTPNNPAHISYIFSGEQDFLIFIASCTVEGISNWANKFVTCFFEFLTLIFASSVTNSIKIILPTPNLAEFGKEIEAEIALKFYRRLDQLVQEFCSIFKWPLFIYKATILMLLCLRNHVLLRLFSGASSILSGTNNNFAGTKFLCFYIPEIIKICFLLTQMGNVQAESESFRNKWKNSLWDSDNDDNEGEYYWKVHQFSNRRALIRNKIKELCHPFGFQCGSFYFLQPWTILTFFSVATTYLIVLLQL